MNPNANVLRVLALAGAAVMLLSPASAADSVEAPKTGTARITGIVPVLRKKIPSAIKEYGPPPAFKVDKPEPPRTAVWVGSGAARTP